MPVINLGVDYEDAKDLDEFPVAEAGTFPFVIKNADVTKAKSTGRDMIVWTLTIQNEKGQDVNLFPNTVLPMEDPATGEMIVKGLFVLVSLCKSVGKPWTGAEINTDDYIGLGGMVEVSLGRKQKQDETGNYVDDPTGRPVNNIEKFIT